MIRNPSLFPLLLITTIILRDLPVGQSFWWACSENESTACTDLFGVPLGHTMCTAEEEEICVLLPLLWQFLGATCGPCPKPPQFQFPVTIRRDYYLYTFPSAPESPIPFTFGDELASVTEQFYLDYALMNKTLSNVTEIVDLETTFVSSHTARSTDEFLARMETTLFINTTDPPLDLVALEVMLSDRLNRVLDVDYQAQYLAVLTQSAQFNGFFDDVTMGELYR